MRASSSGYLADNASKRVLRTARFRLIAPFFGFGGLSLILISGVGGAVAVATFTLIVVIYGVAAAWVKTVEDAHDEAAQRRAGPSAVVATPAMCVFYRGSRQAVRGELRLTPSSVDWFPLRSSSLPSFGIAHGDITYLAVAPRGLLTKRGSLVVWMPQGPVAFLTAARFNRLSRGVEQLGLPKPSALD